MFVRLSIDTTGLGQHPLSDGRLPCRTHSNKGAWPTTDCASESHANTTPTRQALKGDEICLTPGDESWEGGLRRLTRSLPAESIVFAISPTAFSARRKAEPIGFFPEILSIAHFGEPFRPDLKELGAMSNRTSNEGTPLRDAQEPSAAHTHNEPVYASSANGECGHTRSPFFSESRHAPEAHERPNNRPARTR